MAPRPIQSVGCPDFLAAVLNSLAEFVLFNTTGVAGAILQTPLLLNKGNRPCADLRY